jgi:serine phosphatase RsbU (regulator of sigma subunit)
VTPDERRDLRIGAVAALLLACGALRLLVMPDLPPFELVPVLAAGLWFGRRWALIVAAVAGAVIAVDAVLSDDGDLLVAAAQLALLGLTAWLVSALAERARRADAELQRIRPLQDVLAPRKPPSLPLLELASRYIPAQAGVSGDFYQVAEARNGAAVLVIGDVVGKGLTAARRSIFVRAMVTACAPYLDDPAAILRTVNTELVHQHGASAQFITMLCVVVKPDMTLTWASAGHPPPVALDDGEPLGHLPTGHPLGIAPEIAELEVGHAALPAGGILLYTDGLTDARPPGRSFQPFGESRIGLFLRELDGAAPDEAVEHLTRAAQAFSRGSLPDDLCVVAVRPRFKEQWYEGGAAASAVADPAAGRAAAEVDAGNSGAAHPEAVHAADPPRAREP